MKLTTKRQDMKLATMGGCLALVLASSASAATITFKQGANVVSSDGAINIANYDGTEDTYIRGSATTTNYGADTILTVGAGTNNVKSTEIRFDVGALQDEYNSIQSMTIRLYVESTEGVDGSTYELTYGAFKDASGSWDEATATYDLQYTSPDTAWAGGDGARREEDAWFDGSGTFTTTGYGAAGTWVEFVIDPSGYDAAVDTLDELLGSWITDGPQNNGIAMTKITGAPDWSWNFASSESLTAANRPELLIEYTVVPEPSSAALLGLGGLALILRRRK